MIKKWMDDVRDEQFLVGRRLRNIGEAEDKTNARAREPPVVPARVVDEWNGNREDEDEWDDV